jgi:hypothetical protein
MVYRVSDCLTGFLMERAGGKVDSLAIELKPNSYPRSWNALDPAVAVWLDPADLQNNAIILIGNIDHENSIRISEKLKEVARTSCGWVTL